MEAVLSKVTFSDRDNFFKRIQAYWTLKRMSRSGVPLLKRLQNQRSTKKKVKRDHFSVNDILPSCCSSPIKVKSTLISNYLNRWFNGVDFDKI